MYFVKSEWVGLTFNLLVKILVIVPYPRNIIGLDCEDYVFK